ncbi:MAG: hypothetical protein R2748_09290 [Bryobacterales bacterium]
METLGFAEAAVDAAVDVLFLKPEARSWRRFAAARSTMRLGAAFAQDCTGVEMRRYLLPDFVLLGGDAGADDG